MAKKKVTRVPCESCGRAMAKELGYTHCPTCWQVEKVLTLEGAANLSALTDPAHCRAALLWRVSNVIERSGVEDAEILIRRLEQNL